LLAPRLTRKLVEQALVGDRDTYDI
jgi:hypothetical protein